MIANRLTLSQLLKIEEKNGLISLCPKIEGWLQVTLRELPFCSECNERMRYLNEEKIYLCDKCGHKTNEGGPIVKQVAQKNIILNAFQLYRLVYNVIFSGTTRLIMILSNDDQYHPKKDMYINTYADKGNYYSYYYPLPAMSIDFSNKIWTLSCTFSAPTAPGRYVRWIGITRVNSYSINFEAYTYAQWFEPSMSGTKLTSEIYQSNTQTLEVVYKYILAEAT